MHRFLTLVAGRALIILPPLAFLVCGTLLVVHVLAELPGQGTWEIATGIAVLAMLVLPNLGLALDALSPPGLPRSAACLSRILVFLLAAGPVIVFLAGLAFLGIDAAFGVAPMSPTFWERVMTGAFFAMFVASPFAALARLR